MNILKIKLNGWQRLFIVLAIIWGIPCLLLSSFNFFIGLWGFIFLFIFFLLWGIPLLIIYGLFKALVWIIDGFRQK